MRKQEGVRLGDANLLKDAGTELSLEVSSEP